MNLFTDPGSLGAFFQVVMIDLVLAGDNAVVIGMAAAGLPPAMRRKAILVGIMAATLMRVLLAFFTIHLLAIVGLLFAGGLLLLWVCWKMWEELRNGGEIGEEALERMVLEQDGAIYPPVQSRVKAKTETKSYRQAIAQIMIADISMSLDNVLAVAGAAREHPVALAFGLLLSVALMGLAATFVAKLLSKYRWIAYFGLLIILIVALRMMYEGGLELLDEAPAIVQAYV